MDTRLTIITNGGPMNGSPVLNIDKQKLFTYWAKAKAIGITYGYGDKDPILGTFPPDYKSIDCSGYVRTTLAYATAGQTNKLLGMPDGSWMEDTFFQTEGFRHHLIHSVADYMSAIAKDNRIRLCFHKPNGRGGDPIGHAFFIILDTDGEIVSEESYGGNGPGSRPWDHLWFMDHCDDVYVLTD